MKSRVVETNEGIQGEISQDIIGIARRNARDCGLGTRVSYVQGSVFEMPFPSGAFDAAFSNCSLHEWEDPEQVFREIARVVKPGGAYCVCDMRRDVSPLIKWPIYLMTKPKEIRPGFKTSLADSCMVEELKALLARIPLRGANVTPDFFALTISGRV